MVILRYRIDFEKIKGPLADYLNNLGFKILYDSDRTPYKKLTDSGYDDAS